MTRLLPPLAPPVYFSLHLSDPGLDLLTRNAGALRCAMRAARRVHAFEIDSIVILPAALHAIWTLPEDDPDLGVRVDLMKGHFDALLAASGDRAEWQGRIWPLSLGNVDDLNAHRAMIHDMPVRGGFSQTPEAWQFSSIHRDRDPRRGLNA